jgi:IS5 family transposase
LGVRRGRTGLIRKAVFTPARTQDNEVAEALISGDEAAVYADRIYESRARRARLKAEGIKDRIMHRRHKHMPVLPRWMAMRNRLISRRRAPVESVFSAMKRIYGKARTQCHSLAANAAQFLAFATVFNLRRATAWPDPRPSTPMPHKNAQPSLLHPTANPPDPARIDPFAEESTRGEGGCEAAG